jgi:putative transposon-encoded protein
MKVAAEKSTPKGQESVEATRSPERSDQTFQNKVKFEIFGEEMLEKEVKLSGNSGRVYLPPDWVGHRVKIVRID